MKKHLYFSVMMILGLVLAVTMAGCGGGSGSPGPGGTGGNSFKIVFISDRNNPSGIFNIFSMNLDGSSPTQLTMNTSEDISCPELSPDYNQIVYAKNNNNNTYSEIWVMKIGDKTGGNKLYTSMEEGRTIHPSWTPGGKIIFRDNMTIYIMDTDRNKENTIIVPQGIYMYPESALRVSPMDSTKIIFNSSNGICTVDQAGNSISNLKTIYTNDEACQPSWSPDGNTIIFTDGADNGGNIYSVSASGGAANQLTTGCKAFAPLFSPDDTKIIFTGYAKGNTTSDIFSMDAKGGNSSIVNLTNNGSVIDGYFGSESQ